MYDIYEKPVEFMWDGTKFGIPNVDASFFLTYSDVNEIIAGDKCLNIAILQLWMMWVNLIWFIYKHLIFLIIGVTINFHFNVQNRFMDEWSSSLGHASVYGFFESHSIHHANDRRVEYEH